jgi:hypothetical protein
MHGAYILIYIHTGVYILLYSLLLEDEPAKVLALVSGQWLALAIWLPTCFAAGES